MVNYDKLTYAGNLDSLADAARSPLYAFVQGDICDAAQVREVLALHRPRAVVNFAAESHVDRSIDAPDAFVAILRDHIADLAGGVAHCFTAGPDEARTYLDLGLHIGITGWLCDERRGLHLKEVVRFVPLDRLLVETDAPYLLPRDLRPKPKSRRNEPCHLPHIVAAIAQYRGESVELVAGQTTLNALELFRWADP